MVKCSECGFIAWRHRETRELVEADGEFRQDFHFPSAISAREYPLCFMRKRNIGKDYEKAKNADSLESVATALGSNQRASILRNVLAAEFPCDSFSEWQQGFTPKEHRELVDRKELLEWQAAREDADRTWRKEQAISERFWRLIQVLVFGLAGGAVAIAAALIGRG